MYCVHLYIYIYIHIYIYIYIYIGGGLLQIVAYGAQDVSLTGHPQITFFKVVYRRHTNFAIEAIQQTPTGSNSWGSRASIQITCNGDLIHRIYFNGKIKNTSSSLAVALVPNFGQKLLKTVEEKYFINYENKRNIDKIKYEKYLTEKTISKTIFQNEKTKISLYNYLKLKCPIKNNIIYKIKMFYIF